MMPEAEPAVLVADDGHVRTVTINRPERRNALSDEVLEGLTSSLEKAEEDAGVRVVILTGAGSAFCAGGDISGHKRRADEGRSITGIRNYYVTRGARAAERILAFQKPIVAAVNGAAAGAGVQLSLFCDLRVASEKAFLLTPFADRGMSPDWFSTQLLPQYIGLGRALDLLLTGRRLGAQEALQWGLFTRVSPAGTFMDDARELAQSLAAKPPVSLSVTKRMLRSWSNANQTASAEFEALALAFCQMTDDHAEAVRAFTEKRPGEYLGR
jgi:enoyl-CoA hydratase/carnithine racemase